MPYKELLSDEEVQTAGSTRRMNLVTMVEAVVARPLTAKEVRALYEKQRVADHSAMEKARDYMEHKAYCEIAWTDCCTCGRDAAIASLEERLNTK